MFLPWGICRTRMWLSCFFSPPSCCRWSKTEGWFDSPSRNNILQLWNRPSLLPLPEPGYRKPAVSSRDRPFMSTMLWDKSVCELVGLGFLRSARRWGSLSSGTGYNCYRRCRTSNPRPSGSTRCSMCPWGHPALVIKTLGYLVHLLPAPSEWPWGSHAGFMCMGKIFTLAVLA